MSRQPLLRRRGAIALLAVPAVALALLAGRPERSDVSSPRARTDSDANVPAPALATGVEPRSTRRSPTGVVLSFPGRTRALDATVLVVLRAAGDDAASFLVTTSARGARAHDVRSPGDAMAAEAGLADKAAEVRVALSGVPSEVRSVEARTIDLEEPALVAAARAWRPEADGHVHLDLETRDASGWLAVRAVRDGEPIGGVSLRVRRGDETLRSLTTRADRRVVVAVPPGEDLALHAADYAGAAVLGLPPDVPVRTQERTVLDVDVALPPGRRVVFRALDPHGEAAAFTLALWRAEEGERPRHVGVSGLVAPDPELRVWRGRLTPGAYVATADPRAHFAPAALRFEVLEEPAEGERSFAFEVRDRGARTSIRLLESDGRPLARTLVTLNREDDRVERLASHTATTDDDGTIRTPPLPAGDYRLHVWKRGLATRVTLGDGSPVERALADVACAGACATLSGTLRDRDGAPARWPKAFLLRADGWAHVVSPDADGRYAFPPVAPGEYAFEVEASPHSERAYAPHRERVRLDAGREVERHVVLDAR